MHVTPKCLLYSCITNINVCYCRHSGQADSVANTSCGCSGYKAVTESHNRDESQGIVNVEWSAPLKDPHVCKTGGISPQFLPMLVSPPARREH